MKRIIDSQQLELEIKRGIAEQVNNEVQSETTHETNNFY